MRFLRNLCLAFLACAFLIAILVPEHVKQRERYPSDAKWLLAVAIAAAFGAACCRDPNH